jgi:hypothetical protein
MQQQHTNPKKRLSYKEYSELNYWEKFKVMPWHLPRRLQVLSGALLFFILVGTCGKTDGHKSNSHTTSDASQPIVRETVYSVSAGQVLYDYQQNEVSADNAYKGKKLHVTGTVREIRKDFMDDIIVELKAGNMFEGVHCYLDDAGFAARLSKGEQVTLQCECDGMVIGTVQMKNCKPVN